VERKYWNPDLVALLEKYYQTKNEQNFKKLLKWLGVRWRSFGELYEVYSEVKNFDRVKNSGEYLDLRLEITGFMIRGAWDNHYDRNQLCILYGIALDEGKEDEALKVIARRAPIGDDYYDAKTWQLFWAYYPDTKLSQLAEKKLAESGSPLKPMSEEEKALTTLQIIMGSVAG